MLNVTVAVPDIFRAVTTYGVAACAVAGVPVILPVGLSKKNPAGMFGAIVKESTIPVTDAVFGDIPVPTVYEGEITE